MDGHVGIKEFRVRRHAHRAQWIVEVGSDLYGAYLDKEQAILDAIDAAREALSSGVAAEVWVRDQADPARVL